MQLGDQRNGRDRKQKHQRTVLDEKTAAPVDEQVSDSGYERAHQFIAFAA